MLCFITACAYWGSPTKQSYSLLDWTRWKSLYGKTAFRLTMLSRKWCFFFPPTCFFSNVDDYCNNSCFFYVHSRCFRSKDALPPVPISYAENKTLNVNCISVVGLKCHCEMNYDNQLCYSPRKLLYTSMSDFTISPHRWFGCVIHQSTGTYFAGNWAQDEQMKTAERKRAKERERWVKSLKDVKLKKPRSCVSNWSPITRPFEAGMLCRYSLAPWRIKRYERQNEGIIIVLALQG